MKSNSLKHIVLQPRTSYEPDSLRDKLRIGTQRTIAKHPVLSTVAAATLAGVIAVATTYAAVKGAGKAADYLSEQREQLSEGQLERHADFYGVSVEDMRELNQVGAENLRNLGNPEYSAQDPLQDMQRTLDDHLYK